MKAYTCQSSFDKEQFSIQFNDANYPNYVQVLCITMGVMSSSLLHKKAAYPVKLNVTDVFFLIK